jgi:import inner membrane translocase subunit TIM54
MRRKLLIVLSAPPADGLLSAREHFHEYVRPILVAGGMDWEAVEGRKEGDVRAQIAERIRDLRRSQGETGGESTEEEKDIMLREMRERLGVTSEPGIHGDIVIGRHTWKEYIRGLHEGWLGPLEQPEELKEPLKIEEKLESHTSESSNSPDVSDGLSVETVFDGSAEEPKEGEAAESAKLNEEEESKEEPKSTEPKLRKQPPPFISTESYSSVPLPTTFESDLGPSVAVPHPHILGILKTPIRIYRFLNRRRLADDVGKQVAAAVLAAHTSYKQVEREHVSSSDTSSSSQSQPESRLVWEQEYLLETEEEGWHKSARKREESDEGKERVWLDPIVLDSRIASRMRKFEVQNNWESNDL